MKPLPIVSRYHMKAYLFDCRQSKLALTVVCPSTSLDKKNAEIIFTAVCCWQYVNRLPSNERLFENDTNTVKLLLIWLVSRPNRTRGALEYCCTFVVAIILTVVPCCDVARWRHSSSVYNTSFSEQTVHSLRFQLQSQQKAGIRRNIITERQRELFCPTSCVVIVCGR